MFHGLPANEQKRGSVDTYLWKEEYQCDHGPEDDRVQAGPLPEKKQRTSKKASGLNLKVRSRSSVLCCPRHLLMLCGTLL